MSKRYLEMNGTNGEKIVMSGVALPSWLLVRLLRLINKRPLKALPPAESIGGDK